jgi:hypothetical protein
VRERLAAAVNGFVDDPAKAVGEADLVADEAARALIESVEIRRSELRAAWEDGAAHKHVMQNLRWAAPFITVARDHRSATTPPINRSRICGAMLALALATGGVGVCASAGH